MILLLMIPIVLYVYQTTSDETKILVDVSISPEENESNYLEDVTESEMTTGEFSSHTTLADEEKSYIEWTLEELQSKEHVFYPYFPQVILSGYSLDDKICVYDTPELYLEASFINVKIRDTLWISVVPKYFYEDVEMGKVYYASEGGSYIYLDAGEWIVTYRSRTCDLQTLEGFEEMAKSAEYFAGK